MMLRAAVPFLLTLCFFTPSYAADASATDAVVTVDAEVAPAGAPKPPESVDEAVDAAKKAFLDFKSEHVRAGIAGIICILMFVWRKFGAGFLIGKIPNKALPFITAGIAFLGALPVALVAEPWSWKTFIWQGLVTGAEAMAFWSLLVKFVLARTLPDKK